MPDVYASARGPLARVASPLAGRARARPRCPRAGVRGRVPPGRPGVVRADARPLVPHRAALAAARGALAAGRAAPPLLAARRRRRVGGDLPACPRGDGGAVRSGDGRALRPAREELGLRAAARGPGGSRGCERQPVRRLMSLLTPLITRNRSRTIPTEL